MSAFQTIGWKSPGPTNGSFCVPEGSDIPQMRARTGPRGTDREMAKLLCEVLNDLAHAPCSFWACEGPSRPRQMATCNKCWSMRNIATILATLRTRDLASCIDFQTIEEEKRG